MLESQSIQLRLSELRQKINSMSDNDDYEVSEMDSLINDYAKLESRYRVAIVKEAEEIESTPTEDLDSEKRETRALERDIEVRHYVHAAIQDYPLEGREREYNDSLKLTGVGTQLPWVALLSPEERAEMRAVTTAPSDSDLHTRSILGRVFAASAADYLGVRSEMVPVGEMNYPVLTGGASPANVENSDATDETAATLTPNVLEPIRLGASYRIRRVDVAKLAMMEDSLRLDLQGAVLEARDKGVIAGNGTAPQVSGFLAGLTDPTNPSAVATFSDYATTKAGLVDGRYAMSEADIKIVCGKETYKHAAGIFQTNSGVSALSLFMPRVSAHVTAPASNIQKAIASRSTGRAVSPMWPAIELIRDIYTGANKGEIVLTMAALWNFKILDTSGYSLLEYKLA